MKSENNARVCSLNKKRKETWRRTRSSGRTGKKKANRMKNRTSEVLGKVSAYQHHIHQLFNEVGSICFPWMPGGSTRRMWKIKPWPWKKENRKVQHVTEHFILPQLIDNCKIDGKWRMMETEWHTSRPGFQPS